MMYIETNVITYDNVEEVSALVNTVVKYKYCMRMHASLKGKYHLKSIFTS